MPAPAEAPQSLYIPQPAVAKLRLPPQFVSRFNGITNGFERAESPWHRHVAAAILYDEAGQEPDAVLADMAQALSTAGKYTYEHPDTPVVALSRTSLQAGISAVSSGLFIRNSNAPSLFHTPVAIMPCKSPVQADIYGSFIGAPELVPRREPYKPAVRTNITAYVTPHVVTPDTLERAEAAAENFLSEERGGVVAIGGAAIAEFFQSLTNPAAEAEDAEMKRQLAALATVFLAEQEFDFGQ